MSESVEVTPGPQVRGSAVAPEVQGSAPQPQPPLDDALQAQRLRRVRTFEVAAAAALAVVAVATAWSGYQATRWTEAQSARYAQASALRVVSTREATLTGQLRLYDLVLVNNWLNAHASGNAPLEDQFRRRFRPEFQAVFDAWLAQDPFNNA